MLQPQIRKFYVLITFLSLLTGLCGCRSVESNPEVSTYIGSDFYSTEPEQSSNKVVTINKPLTLERAVQIGLLNNPTIVAGKWDTRAAKAEYDRAASQRWPQLRAVADYRNYANQQRLSPPSPGGHMGAFSDEIVSGNLVMNMPLYTGGRITNQIKAAQLLRQAQTHRLARNKNELVFNISSLYYSILAQHHIIDSVRFSREAIAAQLDKVKDMIANDKAAPVEQMRIEVRLADIEQQLITQQNALDIKRETMYMLLGVTEPNEPVKLAGKLSRPNRPEIIPAQKAITQAFEHRNDYRAAQSQLKARTKRVKAAQAGHFPDISLVGSYGTNLDARDTSTNEEVGSIGVALSIPLFTGGGIDAEIRKEKAQYRSAKQRLRKLKLDIRLEVKTALKNLESATKRVQAASKSIEQGRESLRIQRLKYDAGKASLTDVLDSQAELLNAEKNYYQALSDYHISQRQLQLAKGRFDEKF